jgi:hypothetical protein
MTTRPEQRTKWIRLAALGALLLGVVGFAGADVAAVLSRAMTGSGSTGLQSSLILRDESGSAPTCATTSTTLGYLCAENGVESEGVLNVAGASTLTGAVALGAGLAIVDDQALTFGTTAGTTDGLIIWEVANQAPDALIIGVGSESRQVHIMESADTGTDLTIAQRTDPGLLIHSADATTAGDYVLIEHDQTNGNINTGAGGLNFASNGATYDFTGDVTIDGAAGSLVFADGDETCLVKDNDTTAFAIGSSGQTDLLEFDTGTNSAAVIVNGTTAVEAFRVDVGMSIFDEEIYLDADDTSLCLGADQNACFQYDDATADSLNVGVSTDSETMHVMQLADINVDTTMADQTNPTLVVWSADLNNDTSDYLAMSHNQANATLTTAQGGFLHTSDPMTDDEAADGDYAASFAQTLNDTSAGTTENYLGLNVDITTTDVSGWGGTTYLAYFEDTNTVMYSVTSAGAVYQEAGLEIDADAVDISLGEGTDATLSYEDITADALTIGLSTDSETLHICQKADTATDWGTADQGNPTVMIHAPTEADTTDYLALTHDDTDGVVSTGAGNVKLVPPANSSVVIASTTITESASSDTSLEITQTLNDTGAVDGTEDYTMIKGTLTVTDGDAWATTWLLDLVEGSTSRLRVSSQGGVTSNGEGMAGGAYTITPTYGANKGFIILEFDGTAVDYTATKINTLWLHNNKLNATFTAKTGAATVAMDATGLDIGAGTLTDNDEMEIYSSPIHGSGRPMTVGTDPAFEFCATIYFTDVSGSDSFYCGWRQADDQVTAAMGYTEFAAIGHVSGAMYTQDEDGADADGTDTWGDTVAKALCTKVSAAGVVTYTNDGSAPTNPGAQTLTSGLVVMPFCQLLHDTHLAEDTLLQSWVVRYTQP